MNTIFPNMEPIVDLNTLYLGYIYMYTDVFRSICKS